MQTLNNITIKFDQIQIADGKATAIFNVTPEIESALKPEFSMWKPEYDGKYAVVGTDGKIYTFRWTGKPNDYERYEAGTMLPVELAETQAEIERITRKLNQAAVVYGGRIVTCGNTPLIGTAYDQYFFDDESEQFGAATFADRKRLAELNASLTKQWQAVLNTQQAQR